MSRPYLLLAMLCAFTPSLPGGALCRDVIVNNPISAPHTAQEALTDPSISVIALVQVDSVSAKVQFRRNAVPYVTTTYQASVRETFKQPSSRDRLTHVTFAEVAGRAKHGNCWYVSRSASQPLTTKQEYLVFLSSDPVTGGLFGTPLDFWLVTDTAVTARMPDAQEPLEPGAVGFLRQHGSATR